MPTLHEALQSSGEYAVKILRLEIEGFRSLRNVCWEPGDLNVLIGPNGSGKSNLLRALELLARSASGGLWRYVQQAGGIEPLLWDVRADSLRIAAQFSPLPPYDSSEG
jgi:predicted ATPase